MSFVVAKVFPCASFKVTVNFCVLTPLADMVAVAGVTIEVEAERAPMDTFTFSELANVKDELEVNLKT